MKGQKVKEEQEEIKLQKVGIQILSDEGLANIFPNYKDLLENIEKCRDRIHQVNRKGHYQYNLMYDNVFSIIGKRGTGKTSAIFTLKKMIEDKNSGEKTQDLLLPIIMPELFSGRDGILDWILAGLEEEVCKIENQFQKENQRDYAAAFDHACRYKIEKESDLLRKKYEYLLEQKFSDKYRVEQADSYYEAIGNSAKQIRNSYRLMKDIYEFWDILAESIKKTAKADGEDREPLIYFFFDDVDLSPDKVEELLTAIRVYLAHPNLAVIITADEDVFLEVIENKLDEKMGRMQKDQRKYLRKKTDEELYIHGQYIYLVTDNTKDSTQDRLSDMSRMYLGKILPPSSRYYLSIFEHPEEKKNFVCSVDHKTVGLFRLLNWQMNYLSGKKPDSTSNFLHYKHEKIIFYLEFIGDTARQISNEIWIINSLVNNLYSLSGSNCTQEEKISHIFHYMHSFLHTTFVNNHRILGIISDTDLFLREILKKEYNDWKLYINYNFVNHFFEKCREEHEGSEEFISEIGIKIYAVLYFAENILLILENKGYYQGSRKKIHGMHHFIEFLNAGGLDSDLLRSSMKLDEFLNHYGNLLMNLEDLKSEDRNSVRYIRKYLYKFSSVKNMEISTRSIFNWYTRDQTWLKTICQILFLYFERIYRFDKDNVKQSLFIEKGKLQYVFEERAERERKAEFEKFISIIDIRKTAQHEYENICKEFQNLAKKNETTGQFYMQICERIEQTCFQQKKKYYTVTDIMTKLTELSVFPEISFNNWKNILNSIGTRLEKLIAKKMAVSECQDNLMEGRSAMEFVKDRIQHVAITGIKEVLDSLKALQEYKDQEYASELQNFINFVQEDRREPEFSEMMVLEKTDPAYISFFRVMQEIYRDTQTGSRVVKKSYGNSYKMYNNICSDIFKHIDFVIEKTDIENVTMLLINEYIFRVVQHFLYIGMIINNMHEINYNQTNIYYRLYEFIKDNILNHPGENIDQKSLFLKNQIEKWIAESRKEYMNKILPNETYREQADE